MTDAHTDATSSNLGIQEGHTVRLIGGTPEFEAALKPLPAGVTVTTLGSEPADIGIIVVDNDNDLRERLFTELNGLLGAIQVWIISQIGTGPSDDDIRTEADVVSWNATTTLIIEDGWLAVALLKK
jgi:hypothetical protein